MQTFNYLVFCGLIMVGKISYIRQTLWLHKIEKMLVCTVTNEITTDPAVIVTPRKMREILADEARAQVT